MRQTIKKPAKKASKHLNKVISLRLPRSPAPRQLKVGEAFQHAEHLARQGQWPAALGISQQLNQLVPAFTQAWLLTFQALDNGKLHEPLLQATDQCLQALPRFVPAYLSKASALRLLSREAEAKSAIEKGLQLEPSNYHLQHMLGIICRELKDFPAAISAFNRCIALQPLFTIAYWDRSDLCKQLSDDEIQQMQTTLEQPALTDANKSILHFALAKAFEYRRDFDAQQQHITLGASLKRSLLDYDHTAAMNEIEEIIRSSSPSTASPVTPASASTDQFPADITPIFICGLPRSGSTLVEHIISSHSQVTAGDEIAFFPQACSEILQAKRIAKAYPHWLEDLSEDDWAKVGKRYRSLTKHLQQTPCFTDKNLQNHKAVQAILKALPQAKIVFCSRHPLDNIWGCFRQMFGRTDMPFTYDLQELTDTYIATHRLMQHWQESLGDRVHIVRYEDMVHNQQETTLQLLQYLGLDMEDTCLEFHNNPRSVRTLSLSQVSEPLSDQRIGQWQHHQQALQGVIQQLQQAGIEVAQG